ncbi:Nif3-like dinuclear metal center hexameric protein [Neisseria gonorrhoeae]|uniref:Nif3-like dinuclear metal center hexameric protein n=1 Tax=Neisseria gonorrhoeae TaxID=485 RepID=UPI000DEB9AD0|nr:Nif3-like dinuclear metal center hexameric protein [Neisseria gonorrhoeae]AZG23901.1 Nif3-like dinuclear metal center hexameric protein [Neisseria gonorrhoeae]AZG30799.1 Nif3-like dinuclear metal center hexameric protein [Neisseria gonorrhoeae]RBP54320.1 dinuclear metal center YbgI/SA1388 family protein [Neisseria gonorrhoeae]ROU96150.1 Nif3-like dinuclear metal center hexameric protein [Neisseria gonorrhoeae]TJX02381.1 Nif3-like dinuclear metal center hexameric protein [Neisseria gonorrhoe
MVLRRDFLAWCDETLQTASFKDYAPNGLQVEGREYIGKIVTSVTASRAAIDFAVEQKADLLLVHHGMFWKSELPTVTGWKKERIAALLRHDINMAGYHLPLDVHPILGNNAQLADRLGFATEKRFGEQNLLNSGSLKQAKTLGALAAHIETVLRRKPVVIGKPEREIRRVAWCTGGAQGFFQTAIDEGVDLYLTGEISEAQYHLANETGTAFISAGHHATERYGVRALAESAAEVFGLEVCHFDENNPA